MQCYEQFGWLPKDILDIPGGEAELLSIYFEEISAHQYKQNQEMKRQNKSSGGLQERETTDLEIGEEEFDEEEFGSDEDED